MTVSIKKILFLIVFQLFFLLNSFQLQANSCARFLDSNLFAWNLISDEFQKSIEDSFKFYSKSPDAKIHTNGHVKWLVKIGFQFEDEDLHKVLPFSLSRLSKKYDTLMRLQIRKYNKSRPTHEHLSEEDIIHIGFEFLNKEGKSITLRYGSTIPEGYFFYGQRLTPGQILYRSLNQGMFPLVSNSITYHDFAHLTSYLEHPEYMAAYKKLARHMMTHFNGLMFTEPMLANHKGLPARVIYFNESLILVSKEKVVEHLDLFTLPKDLDIELEQESVFPQILAELRKLNPVELISKANAFLQIVQSLTLELGGGARDSLNSNNVEFHSIEYVLRILKEDLVHLSRFQEYKKLNVGFSKKNELDNRKRVENSFAKLQAAILLLSQISPAQWGRYIIQNEHSESIITHFFRVISFDPYFGKEYELGGFSRRAHDNEGW